MKITPVRQTSLLAYAEILQNLGERQMQVLKCLDTFYSATNLMIARKMGLDINCVVPRIFELRQLGLVIEDKICSCKITGKRSIYWRFKKR